MSGIVPSSSPFQLVSAFDPAGDQPTAIQTLCDGLLKERLRDQVLLGATGTGKTFTMAQIIQRLGRPSLIMAPNKTLAAQLYGEMKEFFPHNAVEYFVSYYDYYQPEAYIPRSDTYIEKTASINEQIDRMRHSATRAILERRDVVIVASVSCIYGLGDPESYKNMTVTLSSGQEINQTRLLHQFVELQYHRNDLVAERGCFRVRGDTIEIFPAHSEDYLWRLSLFGDEIEAIHRVDPLTGKKITSLDSITIYPNSHFVTGAPSIKKAMKTIKQELKETLNLFNATNKLVEAQRLEQRTLFDLDMMENTGICPGIENYSRHLTRREPGMPPPTLFEYLPQDALLFVDESHVAVPQIGAMFKGDRRRKETLSEYGFRLPSCKDNRPLKFEEWDDMRPPTIYVSATPGDTELDRTGGVFAEQIIRPTGLVDPECIIRPASTQIDDLIGEIKKTIEDGHRVLVTTLTKRMSEDLTDYLDELSIKVRYLHSDIDTLQRIELIQELRMGSYDVLVGINLLREGLDIPECGLVAILDADKEGFLRSKTSLVQTIGRAARNAKGRVILYADNVTESISYAIEETERRRAKQMAYNEKHNITPKTIIKKISAILDIGPDENQDSSMEKQRPNIDKTGLPKAMARKQQFEQQRISIKHKTIKQALNINDIAEIYDLSRDDIEKKLSILRKEMLSAATDLEFEKAATLRDQIKECEDIMLKLS